MSIDDVASIVGMSRSYVNELENGKKTINGRRLEQFAAAFGVSVYDLIEDNDVSQQIMRLVEIAKQLSPDDRAAVMRHASSLLAAKPE